MGHVVPSGEKIVKEKDPLEAARCDVHECDLPYCHCSYDGTEIPAKLHPEEVDLMSRFS